MRLSKALPKLVQLEEMLNTQKHTRQIALPGV